MLVEWVMVVGMMQGEGEKKVEPPPPQVVECKEVKADAWKPVEGKCQPGQREGRDVTGKVVYCVTPLEPRGCRPKVEVPVEGKK